MIFLNKAIINGNQVDIVDMETYFNNISNLDNNYNGVQIGEYIFPLRGKNDTRPGIYNHGNFLAMVVKPKTEIEKEEYSSKKIIDFNNSNGIKDVIDKQNKLRNMEAFILTSADNIFVPNIDANDSAEMIALKEATIAKHIDLDKYEQRFGSNYNNDRRLFNKHSITLVKLKSIADALDMKISLSIEDKSPDVPNPIGKKITVDITGGNEDDTDPSGTDKEV